jgi:hypothetical protein
MTERDYQLHLNRGFHIIRLNVKMKRIEMKKRGSDTGWSIMDQHPNMDFLRKRLNTYLLNEKTIQDF